MRRWLWTIAAAFLAVAVLSRLIWGSVVQRLLLPDFGARAGAFGDIAGALFSALAFALLIVTALMQREELSLQREELRETREELKRTADAQEASERALQAQVEAAVKTARLNALAALLNSSVNSRKWSERLRMEVYGTNPVPIENKIKEILQELGTNMDE